MSHVKIMKKASKALEKDAKHYKKEEKDDKKHHAKKSLKHHKMEEKEAKGASLMLKKKIRTSHE